MRSTNDSTILSLSGPLSEEQALKLLNSRRNDDIAAGARWLGEQELASAVSALTQTYDRLDSDGPKLDKGCRGRRAIVEAFGRIGAGISAPTVRRAIRTVQVETVGFGREDTALDLRATAALAIAQVDPINAIHDLAILLFDEEPNTASAAAEWMFAKARTRMAAAQAIGALGDSAGAALLAVRLRFASSEVSEVLAQCLESFAGLNPPNVLEVAAPHLKSRDPFLAGSAAAALSRHCGDDALDLLVESSPEMPRECIVPLVLLITGIRSNRTGEALTAFFNHRDPKVRFAAVEGAALYPNDVVRERLEFVAASDPDPAVRQAAAAMAGS